MEIPTYNPEKWLRMNDSKKYFSVLNRNSNCLFSYSIYGTAVFVAAATKIMLTKFQSWVCEKCEERN